MSPAAVPEKRRSVASGGSGHRGIGRFLIVPGGVLAFALGAGAWGVLRLHAGADVLLPGRRRHGLGHDAFPPRPLAGGDRRHSGRRDSGRHLLGSPPWVSIGFAAAKHGGADRWRLTDAGLVRR